MAKAKPPKPSAEQTDGQKLANHWITQLDLCDRWQRDYIARSKRIIRRYKNEIYADNSGETLTTESRRFAILWSNTQTLGPAVYSRSPTPLVSRRFKDPDPVAKWGSEILQRGLAFGIDAYDFDARMMQARDDFLLLARGQVWVRYVPHVGKVGTPEAAPVEDKAEGQVTNDTEADGAAEVTTYQEAVCDHVAFDDWGMQPCRTWAEADYVWRRVYMTRAELIERFGSDKGDKVPLDWKPDTADAQQKDMNSPNKAMVYEICDKPSGKFIWVSKAWPLDALDSRDDPLGLTGFFPCPRPVVGTTGPDSYIPIPDYVYYRDQAEELDELTQRIGLLTDALKMVGFYAGEEGVLLQNVFQGNQNTLIPVTNMASLQDKGGAKGIVEWMPIDMVIDTLRGCFETRRQILDDIYQITGLSDIIRGESDPNETATAQRLKGQWGSLRVRDKQKEMQRFARDVLDLKAQIMAKKFTAETFKQMTDVKLLTQAEKQQIQVATKLYQEAVQTAQASQGPPPPPPQFPPGVDPQTAQDLMQQPTWEEVIALLQGPARQFRIDIETDSTIEPDEQASKQSFNEFVTASVSLMEAAGTIIPTAPYTAPLFAEYLKQGARLYRVSPTLEDTIDKVFSAASEQKPAQPQAAAPSGPSPEELQLKAQEQTQSHQLEGAKLGLEQQQMQQDRVIDFADLQLRANEQHLKAQAVARDPNPQGIA